MSDRVGHHLILVDSGAHRVERSMDHLYNMVVPVEGGAEGMMSLGEALVAGLARQDDQWAVSGGAPGEGQGWTTEFGGQGVSQDKNSLNHLHCRVSSIEAVAGDILSLKEAQVAGLERQDNQSAVSMGTHGQ